MATAERSARVVPTAARAARVVVPVVLGAWTWLLVVLAGGALLSTDGLSVFTVVLLGGLAALFVPLVRFRPWKSGVTPRVLTFLRTNRLAFAVVGVLFAVVHSPALSDPLSPVLGLLLLPLRAVPQVLFDVQLFYDRRLGAPAGRVLFGAGRLYVELLWLLVLGRGVAKLASLGGGDG